MGKDLISVVIPVFNSEETLVELFTRIQSAFSGIDKNYEVVFVDDGSKDDSWQILTELKNKNPDHITIVQLSKNYGQHNALVCGFNFSKGEMIVTMDDDLQHLPEEIGKLVQKQAEHNSDIVYGTYPRHKQSFVRSAGSYFMRKTSRYVSDTIGEGTSFRLIKKDIIEKITSNHRQNFVFLDELIQWYTGSIATIPVKHESRRKGKSGYSLGKLFAMYFDIVINYTAVPLKLMTVGGIMLSLVTFSLGVWFIIKKIVYGIPVIGYASLIVAILFSMSIMLICFGIIGQYLHRIFKNQNNKPPYSIKRVI